MCRTSIITSSALGARDATHDLSCLFPIHDHTLLHVLLHAPHFRDFSPHLHVPVRLTFHATTLIAADARIGRVSGAHEWPPPVRKCHGMPIFTAVPYDGGARVGVGRQELIVFQWCTQLKEPELLLHGRRRHN